MGRIHKYATDTVLTLDDKVLGTDKTGTTKNFKLGDIGSFVQTNYSNLDIANGSNNRIITAVDADSLNGEANLTFDGSELSVTGTAYITKNLRRTVTAVAGSSSGGTSTHTCNLSLNDNFSITAANEANVIDVVIASSNIGQSGNIIITNPSSVGSLTFTALASKFKTPSGATIDFDTTASKIAVISYIVLATDSILVNYIGDFS